MSNLPDPITRREIYYNAIANGETDVPDPIMREEIYLKAIAENGGGGGGTGEVTGVKGDAENKYRKGNVNLTPANIGIGNAHVGTVGLVKPDGESTTVDNDGTIHAAVGDSLPTGGTTGQALVKNSDDDKDVKWQTVGGSDLPSGGTTGQILAKHSNTDGDVEWKNEKSEIPSGGTEGQVLTKNSAHDGDVKWANAGGGTSDYSDLSNKPQINSNTLSGNKSAADLGLATDAVFTGADGSTAGAKGLVPAPAAGDNAKYLKGDGTWGNPSGGGGTSDYTDLTNKPQINGHTLSGNQSASDLGIHENAQGDWSEADSSDPSYIQNKPSEMPSADMSEVVSPLPSVMSRRFKYSTSEQVVGEWIDGKPLYQISTDAFGALPNNTTKEVQHNIPNIDLVVYAECVAYKTAKDGMFQMPVINADNINYQCSMVVNRTVIQMATKYNRSAYDNTIVTIRYTKTTD